MPENPADDSSTVPVEQNDSTASGNGRETAAAAPTVVATTESAGDRIVGAAAVERHAASADAARADSPPATVAATGHRPAVGTPASNSGTGVTGTAVDSAAKQPPTAARVAFPRGVLSATALSGVAAALFVPVDRPGIGWLLTGLIVAATIVTVDYAARRSTNRSARTSGDGALAVTVNSGRPEMPENKTTEEAVTLAAVAPAESSAPQRTVPTGNPAASTSTAQPKPAETSGSAVRVVDSEHPSAAAFAGGASTRTTDGAATSSSMSETRTRTTTPISGGEQPEVGASASPFWFGARVWWSALALALLAVGAFRASEWLFILCVLTAGVVASLAVVRRSAHGVVFEMAAVPLTALLFAVPWLYHGVTRVRRARMSSQQRVWWSALVTVALLVVFVPLLAGADAVFATLVDGVLPSMDAAELWRWVLLFLLAALGTAGALYLLAAPPPAAGTVVRQRVSRRLTRLEWALPVGALTMLFAVFVGTQLAVLFGGDDYVQRTADLTYAEYARSGFWQLSAVSVLTLAVITVVQRWAARDTVADRAWLRVALAAVSVLTLVIVASALSRMWTYQQAYGFTVLRLLVEVFELWIAAVYLLVLASLVRLRQGWLPRAAVGAAAATLLALAIMNPERLIADRNIDRWEAGKSLDTDYLNDLSADVLPAADRLPDALRREVVGPIVLRLDDDTWRDWNLSRANAR
ncbi:Uncharacterised protein [Nocardia otitidiscaviarum]|uniref:Uncharacterized protein n=1 Tax=Nocardia otitidiscaviarum TaxID=1823 RepID=A0A379JKB9_9NOCA|nr:DUF4173 domain-containing protein [Nocardia otitidiscaviarum]SUD48711.1 Uncharacterised protein [Nocardia otitidiscaviarum]